MRGNKGIKEGGGVEKKNGDKKMSEERKIKDIKRKGIRQKIKRGGKELIKKDKEKKIEQRG